MIQRIHSSHIGIEGCLRRARVSLYWPGMDAQVRDCIQSCETCLSTGPKQQKETMIPHEVKNHPWSKVGLDLFDFNQRTYLVTVDYYSNFFEVYYLQCITSKDVIHKVKAHFARYGIPDTVISVIMAHSFLRRNSDTLVSDGGSNTSHPPRGIRKVMECQKAL